MTKKTARKNIMSNMRYLRYFSGNGLENYTDYKSVSSNLEQVFEMIREIENKK